MKQLSDLLEAVCEHEDCPDWLKDGIWDLVNQQAIAVTFTSLYWQATFQAIEICKRQRAEAEKTNVLPFAVGNRNFNH